jgi:hypothetical protein
MKSINIEKLVKQQSEHLDHLQGRIDLLQASVGVVSAFVAALLAVVPPERYAEKAAAKRLKAYMATYAKSVKQDGAQLSEFPFVPVRRPRQSE